MISSMQVFFSAYRTFSLGTDGHKDVTGYCPGPGTDLCNFCSSSRKLPFFVLCRRSFIPFLPLLSYRCSIYFRGSKQFGWMRYPATPTSFSRLAVVQSCCTLAACLSSIIKRLFNKLQNNKSPQSRTPTINKEQYPCIIIGFPFRQLWNIEVNNIILKMMSDENSCEFICFNGDLCNKKQQEDESSRGKFGSFEKLSLKRMKEDAHPLHRTQSFKKLDRPIPTTERSGREDAQTYLQHLVETKKRIEQQLSHLNHDFDKYYEIYSNKVKELKTIRHRMQAEARTH